MPLLAPVINTDFILFIFYTEATGRVASDMFFDVYNFYNLYLHSTLPNGFGDFTSDSCAVTHAESSG